MVIASGRRKVMGSGWRRTNRRRRRRRRKKRRRRKRGRMRKRRQEVAPVCRRETERRSVVPARK